MLWSEAGNQPKQIQEVTASKDLMQGHTEEGGREGPHQSGPQSKLRVELQPLMNVS